MKYKILIADIETTAIEHWPTLKGLTVMHCMSILDMKTKNLYEFNTMKDNISEGLDMLEQADYVAFHNGIGFDAPALRKLYGISIPKVVDTQLMAKLIFPDIKDADDKREDWRHLKGSHSLKAWGVRLGNLKGDYGSKKDAWDLFTPEMQHYCSQDVKVTYDLCKYLMEQNFSSKALVMEHEFAKVMRQQEENGFTFNVQGAENLARDIMVRKVDLEKELQEVFPPTSEKTKRPIGWKVEVEGIEFTAKTKIQLKQELKKGGFKQSISDFAEKMGYQEKEVLFNPGSRTQIASRLQEDGWTPTKFTSKGNIIIDEEVLRKIATKKSLKLLEYLMVQKRLSQLLEGKYAWLSCVTPEGRIHGSVNTAGTITGRCTHLAPNISQVPAPRLEYGAECRALFTAPEGKVLCGIDASSIEARMLAHFLYKYDGGEFTGELLEGDIHQVNADNLGISRAEAKTFLYAYLYGCGNTLLGEIVGGGLKEGKKLRKDFLNKMPAFKKLLAAVQRSVKTNKHLIGLDGRVLKIRENYKALNSLLQNAASIVMKQALLEFIEIARHPYELHANVHDEVQLSCLKAHAEDLGSDFVDAIKKAGKVLGIKCPLDGEYNIGNNWAETH